MTFVIRLKGFYISFKTKKTRFKRDGDLFKGELFVNKC